MFWPISSFYKDTNQMYILMLIYILNNKVMIENAIIITFQEIKIALIN